MTLAPPPRFWFLPATAAAALFLGLSAFHAEEDPNDPFVYDRTESVLHLSLDAPGGTSLSPYDSPVAVGVLLERYSWQIWRQPSTGAEEYREPGTVPESGATVTLTRSPEMGTLAESTLITGSDGRAWTTFSPDGATSNVSIDATSGDSTAALSFSITSTPGFEESWYLSHTEATLVAEITSVLSTQDVPSGENRDLSLSVRYETWDVMASNLGNTRTENFTSAPAEGASVTWSLESGDGSVSGYGTTDSGGLAQGSFTMGSGESIIRAEIAYATGQATTATLTFSPQASAGGSGDPAWTQIGSETIPTIVNLSVDGSTELASGETRQFTGQVQGEVWDIWTDGTTEDRRYNYTTSLSWIPLFADVTLGVGSIGTPNLTTDGSGWFSTSYTMGTGPAQIALRFDPLANPAATIDFSLGGGSGGGGDAGTGSGNMDDWSYLYTEGYYSIQDLVIDGPTYDLVPGDVRTISGTLVWVQWEVWGNSSGSTQQRYGNASPMAWTNVHAVIATGDGTLSATGMTTGSLGEFSTGFTMGTVNSTVTLSVDSPQGTTTYVGFTRPAPPEQWTPVRTESSIVVSLAADDSAASREPGQSLPLRATVTATTWEMRQSDRTGELRGFDHQTGPAIGATVDFSQLSGPGTLTSSQAVTNSDGVAEVTFVLGESASTIRAGATFQTASSEAEVVVSPDVWVYQSSHEHLELALSLHGDPANPTAIGATLQVHRSETWRNLATQATETRHQSLSPAENGQITYTAAEGASVTFGANPLFTDVSGNAITEYRSNGSIPLTATASFAGMTATSSIAAPQGWGLSGTDGGGTDGSGTDGGGNEGTGHQNQNETSGGDNNNTVHTDPETPSDVNTELVRRTHSVSWNERGSDGPSGEVTKKYYFRATLERNITDENGEPQTRVEEVEGERQHEGEILLQWYLEGWYLVGQVEYFERDEVELVTSGGGSGMGDLLLAGYPSFDTEYSILRCLVTAETFAEFEGNDHVSAGLVNGALASSFGGDPWEEAERLYFTTLNGSGGPGTDQADYVASPQSPEASWSEYWLEAGSSVAHDTIAKRTFVIHATRRNDQFVKTGEWIGTVTFKIVGNGHVSNRTPVLNGFAETDAMGWLHPTEDGRLLVKPDVVKGAFHEVSLLPVELTAHRRGTIDAPGAAISRPGGNEVYEVVTLENADYDETDWTPTSMADGALENNQDGKTDAVSTDKDDDFVKLRLSCPLSGVAGSSEIVFDQAGQGERMQDADIRFHNSNGERVQRSALKIDDLQNPSGPLAPAFTGGGLDLFVEIGDLGEITGQSAQANSATRKYADLIWKITVGGTTIEQKVRIYRGGFWRCDRTDNSGTIALYDGKGRLPDGTIDYGQIVKGPYQIKTGQEGHTDETVPNVGPTPMGWYGLYARNRGNNNTDMRTSWLGSARPQTNHHLNSSGSFLGYVQQGSYCQWAQAGNHNIPEKGAYGYDNGNDSAPYDGMPASIHFKFQLVEIGEFTNRTDLQIHPDGFCDGTAGCVGVQAYDDCCKVLFLVRHYFQTRLLVD